MLTDAAQWSACLHCNSHKLTPERNAIIIRRAQRQTLQAAVDLFMTDREKFMPEMRKLMDGLK